MAKGNEKKYVKIQSNMTVRVTSGLQFDDFTKKQSDVPDRMKVAPAWPKMMVVIQQGQHTYPAEIAEWETVKSLQKDKVLTIGDFTDEENDGAEAIKQQLVRAKQSTASLADIAGE